MAVEFDGDPYCLWYVGWTPSVSTRDDIFGGEDYPNKYGMIDGEFLSLIANRTVGDLVFAKQTPDGDNTLVYLSPDGSVEVVTAENIDAAAVKGIITAKAGQDLNIETNGEKENGEPSDGSTWIVRASLTMDTYGGLTVRSNGADMVVETNGGNLSVTTAGGNAEVDAEGGDITLKGSNITLNAIESLRLISGGDAALTAAGGPAVIAGQKVDLRRS